MATRVRIIGVDKFRNFEVQSIQKLSDKQVYNIAKETEKVIKSKIAESIQRPGSTGKLAGSMFSERIGHASFGVGNIGFLNHNAPYWRWINYGVAGTGRRIPPPTKGSFIPSPSAPQGNAFRTGRFSQGNGGFSLFPAKPIEPHNYIQKTLFEVNSIISKVLRRIKR